jgi:EPS-associated MarR family transcriptional regulator
MSEQSLLKEENLLIINEIESKPATTQRDIAISLGISLGKTNYLLKELIKKGFIEAKNFTDGNGKLRKIQYLLTREGLQHKIFLMQHFLLLKEEEFKRLKQEWEDTKNNHTGIIDPNFKGERL